MKVERAGEQRFIDFFNQAPYNIYYEDKRWIAPITQEVDMFFDPYGRGFSQYGECDRWVIRNDGGIILGRIATFIDKRTAFSSKPIVGHIGLFECRDNKGAALALIETAQDWLLRRRVEVIDGPIGLGIIHPSSGLRISGKGAPSYRTNYNPPYYTDLLLQNGFREYYQQHTYRIEVGATHAMPDMLATCTAAGYRLEHIDLDETEQYAPLLSTLYNVACTDQPHTPPLTTEEMTDFMEEYESLIDPAMAVMAFQGSEPVGVLIVMPDLNRWYKRYDGNLSIGNRIRFHWDKRFVANNRLTTLMYGVAPAHRGTGVEIALIQKAEAAIRKIKKWEAIDITEIGDYNPPLMNSIAAYAGGEPLRSYATYRKIIDETKYPFSRYTKIL